MDKINIKGLRLRCVIGIHDWEKQIVQDVAVSLALHVDLTKPGKTDNIADTVDYKKLKKKIMAHVEHQQFGLIEKMAQDIADICLAEPLVQIVDVTVDKLDALRFAQSVSVEISRSRKINGL